MKSTCAECLKEGNTSGMMLFLRKHGNYVEGKLVHKGECQKLFSDKQLVDNN